MKLAGIAIGLVVLTAVFALLEWLWPAKPEQRRLRDGFSTDLAYWFFTPLVSRSLTRAAVIVVAVAFAFFAGVTLDKEHVTAFLTRSTLFGAQPKLAQIVEILVIGDFLGYWLHRMFHRGRLWRFHAIHHASKELDWLSAVRLHPVNDVLQRILQVIPFFVLGFDGRVVAAYAPFLAFFAIALHANVSWNFGPLRYVIASPTFHRWHHTSETEGLDKNFGGLFPAWDLLFGTFYMPAGKRPEAFGVRDAVPATLWGQLAWPFTSR